MSGNVVEQKVIIGTRGSLSGNKVSLPAGKQECKFFSCETGGKLTNERSARSMSGKNVQIH